MPYASFLKLCRYHGTAFTIEDIVKYGSDQQIRDQEVYFKRRDVAEHL